MKLHESASLSVIAGVLGATVWGQQSVGSRFHLAQAAQVTALKKVPHPSRQAYV
jgi:hypothetical protein